MKLTLEFSDAAWEGLQYLARRWGVDPATVIRTSLSDSWKNHGGGSGPFLKLDAVTQSDAQEVATS